jgi:hypothetical protein
MILDRTMTIKSLNFDDIRQKSLVIFNKILEKNKMRRLKRDAMLAEVFFLPRERTKRKILPCKY